MYKLAFFSKLIMITILEFNDKEITDFICK